MGVAGRRRLVAQPGGPTLGFVLHLDTVIQSEKNRLAYDKPTFSLY